MKSRSRREVRFPERSQKCAIQSVWTGYTLFSEYADRPRPSTPNEPDGRDPALPKRTRRPRHRSPKRTESPQRSAPETNPTRPPAAHRNEPNRPGSRSPNEATEGPPFGPIVLAGLDIGSQSGPDEVDRSGHPAAPETNPTTATAISRNEPNRPAVRSRNEPNPEGAGSPNEANAPRCRSRNEPDESSGPSTKRTQSPRAAFPERSPGTVGQPRLRGATHHKTNDAVGCASQARLTHPTVS
jgi:hypothetical protein